MMMGKVKNTAVYPRGHIKLQQLAEISGTWLAHWQHEEELVASLLPNRTVSFSKGFFFCEVTLYHRLIKCTNMQIL